MALRLADKLNGVLGFSINTIEDPAPEHEPPAPDGVEEWLARLSDTERALVKTAIHGGDPGRRLCGLQKAHCRARR
jgi:hypothetical protein